MPKSQIGIPTICFNDLVFSNETIEERRGKVQNQSLITITQCIN